MKGRDILVIAILVASLCACSGEQGEQGLVGPKGDPCEPDDVATAIVQNSDSLQALNDDMINRYSDFLGSPDTPAQVLIKLLEVDGAGSGLDADTVDGVEVTTLVDRIEQLESQVRTLTTALEQVQAAQQASGEEVLYAFDGDGRPLGRVVSMAKDSVVYFDKVAGTAVEAYVANLGGELDGIVGPKIWYDNPDCSENLASRYLNPRESSRDIAILDQQAGRVYAATSDALENAILNYWKNPMDGTCQNEATTFDGIRLEMVHLLEPYTPGVYVSALN